MVLQHRATPSERKALVEKWRQLQLDPPKQHGDIWHLVSRKWYNQFQLYLKAIEEDLSEDELDSMHPGRIDNSDIIDSSFSETQLDMDAVPVPDSPQWAHDIKEGLTESDYVELPAEPWTLLKHSFGGGHSIARICADESREQGGGYEQQIRLCVRVKGKPTAIDFTVPVSLKYQWLREKAAERLSLPASNFALVEMSQDEEYNLDKAAEEYKDPPTLKQLGVLDEMVLYFVLQEPQSEDPDSVEAVQPAEDKKPIAFTIPSAAPLKNSPAASMRPRSPISALPKSIPALTSLSFNAFNRSSDTIHQGNGCSPGYAGLQNLGNTCFMNSALQCLTHCVPVLKCFLSGRFEEDLNPSNPLGKKREMAEAFGALAQKLWQGNVKYVVPDGFKRTLGRHAAQFQGYEQHDSQEFLSYLLDMLHEDLNRVKDKPYIEEKDDAGRDDDTLAKEAWDNYRARNDSAIVDHFQGLLKSTLDCPNCGHHKRKFDPYMYLSVPLPGADTVLRKVTLIHVNGASRPREFCVRLFKHDTVAALIDAMIEVASLPKATATRLLVVWHKAFNNYGKPHLQVLQDLKKELPPERSFSKDRILMYLNPDDGGDADADCNNAFIIPHTGHDALPMLLRVPRNAIEIEDESIDGRVPSITSVAMYNRKRQLLRSDCELARRVEDLFTPFKRPRVQSNLVYSQPVAPPSPASPISSRRRGDPSVPPLSCAHVDMEMANQDDAVVLPQVPACHDDSARNAPHEMAACLRQPDETVGAAYSTDDHMKDYVAVDVQPISMEEDSQQVTGNAEDGQEMAWDRAEVVSPVGGLPGGHSQEHASLGPLPGSPHSQGHEAFEPEDNALSLMAPAPVEPAAPLMITMNPSSADWNGRDIQTSFGGGNDHQRQEKSTNPAISGPSSLAHDACGKEAPPVAAPVPEYPLDWCREAAEDASSDHASPTSAPAARLLVVSPAGNTGASQVHTGSEDTQIFQLDLQQGEVQKLIDIEAMKQVDPDASLDQLHEHHDYTLEECIATYLASEVLGLADLWHCPKCRTDVRARKALDLWLLPDVLIIHLKRFSYSGFGYYTTTSSKITNLVNFPLKGLDMSKFVRGNDPSAIYDCFAVSNHMGTVTGGHYTAHCLHEDCLVEEAGNPGWHSYNDSTVHATSPESVVTSSAYVLFYRRRSSAEQDSKTLLQSCKDMLNQRLESTNALKPGAIDPVPCSKKGILDDIAELDEREDWEDGAAVQPPIVLGASEPPAADHRNTLSTAVLDYCHDGMNNDHSCVDKTDVDMRDDADSQGAVIDSDEMSSHAVNSADEWQHVSPIATQEVDEDLKVASRDASDDELANQDESRRVNSRAMH